MTKSAGGTVSDRSPMQTFFLARLQHLMEQRLVHAIQRRQILRSPDLRQLVEIHNSASFASAAVREALMRLILTPTLLSLMPAMAAISL